MGKQKWKTYILNTECLLGGQDEAKGEGACDEKGGRQRLHAH